MSAMQRRKGARAERQLAQLLRDELGDGVRRNLDQCRHGGCDLLGVSGFALEVKRAARPRLADWWQQACAQSDPGDIPALAYRLDRQEWRFVLPLGALHPSFAAGDTRLTVNMGLAEFAAVVRESLSNRPETGERPDA